MICPKCGDQLKVIDSRQTTTTTKRRRRCVSCEYAETTYEIEKTEYEEYLKMRKILDNFIKLENRE